MITFVTRTIVGLGILLFSMGGLISTAAATAGSASEEQLIRYIAGACAINAAPSKTGAQRIEAYHRLIAMSGLQPADARRYIEEYRGRPVEWAALLKKVREQTEKCPDRF